MYNIQNYKSFMEVVSCMNKKHHEQSLLTVTYDLKEITLCTKLDQWFIADVNQNCNKKYIKCKPIFNFMNCQI